MLRPFATASVLALIISACAPAGEDEKLPPAEEAAVGEAAGAAPQPAAEAPADFQLSYRLVSENYEVSLEIDPAILAFDPPLAWRLWTDARTELDAFGASADADRKTADADAAAGGDNWFRGYTLDINHTSTLVLEDVISVSDSLGTYTGGAHPNYVLAGSVYRKGEGVPLGLSAFIADPPAFNDLVVRGLVDEKMARGYGPSMRGAVEAEIREYLAPSLEVPDIYAGRFVLEPSTEAGKVGGITVLFSPYDVGSYAEGAYTVTLPAANIAPVLTEAWAGRFGGEPVAPEGSEAP